MRERGVWFSVPAYALLGLVLVWPTASTLYLSLFSYRMLTGRITFAGLSNYTGILRDATFWLAAWNTILYAGLSVAAELVLGLAMAVLLNRRGALMALLRGAVIAPWVLSPVVAGLMWRMLFHPNYGVLNYLLTFAGVPMGRLQWLSAPGLAMAAVITTEVWQNTPFVFIIAYAALQALPPEPLESAAADGASAWQIFWLVTLPQLLPALAVAGAFRLIFALREFTLPWTLTGGGPANATLMLSIYLYRQMLQFFEVGRAAAVGWLMFLLTAMVVALLLLRVGRPTAEGA